MILRRTLLLAVTALTAVIPICAKKDDLTGPIEPEVRMQEEINQKGQKQPSFNGGSQPIDSPIETPVHKKIGGAHYHQYPVASYISTTTNSGLTADEDADSLSGYDAFKNLVVVAPLLYSNETQQDRIQKKLIDPDFNKKLYTLFSPLVSASRQVMFAADYIEDTLYVSLKSARKVTIEQWGMSSMDVSPLNLDEQHIVSYDNYTLGTPQEKRITQHLVKLTKDVAKQLATTYCTVQTEMQGMNYPASEPISRAAIFEAYLNEAKKAGFTGIDQATLSENFPTLQEITINLEQREPNVLELGKGGTTVHTKRYGPEGKQVFGPSGDGRWLAETDFKNLNEILENDPAWLLATDSLDAADKDAALSHIPILKTPLHVIDFSAEQQESVSLFRCRMFLMKDLLKHKACQLYIKQGEHWYSCCLQQKGEELHLTITDSRNKDRSNDKEITFIAKILNEELKRNTEPKKTAEQKRKEDTDLLNSLLEPKNKQAEEKSKSDETTTNYDAPYAHISLEDLPKLEDLFGDEVPNAVKLRLEQLKHPRSSEKPGTKLKNALLIYGPPGTGKSTFAQVLARSAGLEVAFANGADFRTAYQGSSRAKLEELVAHAEKVFARTGKRVAIIIDEIDGTSSKIGDRNSTDEDNRAIKALIGILDQYRLNPKFYFIGTTNYPDRLDPAILRRFERLEIPLPDTPLRKKIIKYYCKLNGIEIENEKADTEKVADETIAQLAKMSADFFDNLVIATEGLSGDAISEIINNAVAEHDYQFKPESGVPLNFRCGIDFSNRSIVQNIGALVASPFIMAGHYLHLYCHTEIERHIASQVSKQWKTKNQIDMLEAENDPLFKSEKLRARRESIFQRWGTAAGHMIAGGFLGGVGGTLCTIALGYLAMKYSGLGLSGTLSAARGAGA